MNKKNKTTLAIIITILIALLVVMFIVYRGQESLRDKDFAPGTEWSNGQDYLVYQENNKTMVKNSLIGLTLEVPENWTAEVKNFGLDEWAAQIKSPDLETDENQIVQQGCFIQLEVVENENNFQWISQRIEIMKQASEKILIDGSSIYSLVKINNINALRKEMPSDASLASVFPRISLPMSINKIAMLNCQFVAGENQNKCQKKLLQILDSIKF